MKDDDKSPQYVFLYLYLALFFGEGDGIENISGFDTDGDTYTGHHSIWLKQGSILFMLIGSFFCMICLLNLIIAMYSNYYEEQRPVAKLLFHQMRAKDSMQYLLRPCVPSFIMAKLDWEKSRRLVYITAITLTLLWLAVISLGGSPIRASVLLAFAFQNFVAGLLITPWVPGSKQAGQPHYLWVCYRADFDENEWQGAEHKRLAPLQRSLEDLVSQFQTLAEAVHHSGHLGDGSLAPQRSRSGTFKFHTFGSS